MPGPLLIADVVKLRIILDYVLGPLGAISNSLAAGGSSTAQNTAPVSASEANSAATSRTGSRENLCEECIQNPLDLIDASIQVRKRPRFSGLHFWLLFMDIPYLMYMLSATERCLTPL